MLRIGVAVVLGTGVCLGPVVAVSADLIPVSQERSVSAYGTAGTPSSDSHSATDFGPFMQTASASSSDVSPSSHLETASGGGGAEQNSQISATRVSSSGSVGAGAGSQTGTSSGSASSHFQLVFELPSPQHVTLNGSVTNQSPFPPGLDPFVSPGSGSCGISLHTADGTLIYGAGAGTYSPPIPVIVSYSAVLPAGQYTLTCDASASGAETHFGVLWAYNRAAFTYQFTMQAPEPAALACLPAIALAMRRRRKSYSLL